MIKNYKRKTRLVDEKLECIILNNKHLRRPDRDGEKEIVDKVDELIRKKVNELKNLFARDSDLIDSLLWLDTVIKYLKTGLEHADV